MRVLFLTQYYHPEPVEKVHDLARGLVRRGHQVEVVTGFPCYPRGEIYPGYRQRLSHREVIDGVVVRRVPQRPDHSRSPVRRALYYLSFAASAALASLNAGRHDVVLVYQAALPVGLSARFARIFRRRPYVLDVVDLWPESVASSGFMSQRWPLALIRAVARFVYSGAARVNVVTQGFRGNLLAMGVKAEKLSVIENWMPSDTYVPVQRDEALARNEGLDDAFVVMYGGNVGAVQGLETLVEAAEMLRDEPGIRFAVVGDGTELPRLREDAEKRGLGNVRFLGRRQPEEMPGLYALADALLVHLLPDPLTDLSIPSKTFAYLASGRPILMAVRGDATRLVNEIGCGMAVPPADPRALADAVLRLRALPAAERQAMADRALEAHRSRYSGEVQIARMEALLLDACRRG